MSRGKLKSDDEECIISNYTFLKSELEAKDLVDFLFEKRVILLDDKEKISNGKTKDERNEHLLITLLHAGPGEAFSFFLESLEEKYTHVLAHFNQSAKTKGEAAKLKEDIIQLTKEKFEKDLHILQLENELTTAKEKLNTCLETIINLSSEIEKLKSLNIEIDAEKNKLKQDIHQYDIDKQFLESKVTRLESQLGQELKTSPTAKRSMSKDEEFSATTEINVSALQNFNPINLNGQNEHPVHTEISLLLVGKTGNGKRSTGNTIFGSDFFKSVDACGSVNCRIQYAYGMFDKRIIKIVNVQGILDTEYVNDIEKRLQDMIDKMKDVVLSHIQVYHAFLIVLRYGASFTKEDTLVITILKEIFGEYFVKYYCVIVMTHGDLYRCSTANKGKKFKTWCSEQNGEFAELYKECGKRAVLFDNRTKDKNIIQKQKKKLLRTIDNLQYISRRFCDEHFFAGERNINNTLQGEQ